MTLTPLIAALGIFLASNILCWHYARELATFLAPAIQWLCNTWSGDFEVVRIAITQPSREWVFFIDAVSTQERGFPKGTLPAQTPLTSSTLVGHAFQPLILLLTLLPLIARKGLRSVAFLALAALVVFALDVPLVLLGAMEDVLVYHLDPEHSIVSPLVIWMNFMNGGGRLMLPVVLGAVIWLMHSRPGSPRESA